MSTIFISIFSIYASNTFGATAATIASGNPDGNAVKDNALSSLFDLVSDSVVQIVSITPPVFNLSPEAQNSTEVAAAFIYDDVGHIVTANHALARATKVSLVFKDGDRI